MNTQTSNYPPGVVPSDIEGEQRKIRYMRRTMRESVQVRLGESYREKQAQRFEVMRSMMEVTK